MTTSLRGADVLARSLDRAGLHRVFTLSGNHIMPIFDAVLGTRIELLHVRQEAAAVLMAGAWARLTGHVGVALVTGGPGHANATAALCTPLASEMPMILLSGHAATDELDRGGFQELPQAEMAATVCKASWMADSAAELGLDLALAVRIAKSGRPGPVHVSLPSDLLDEELDEDDIPWPVAADFVGRVQRLGQIGADAVLAALKTAERPLILVGPQLCGATGRAAQRRLEDATGVPVVGMESPRGLNDPSLGVFAEVLRQADLLVMLGKPLDFTLRFGDAPSVDADCRFVVLDPDAEMLRRVARDKRDRLVLSAVADSLAAADDLTACAEKVGDPAWRQEVRAAIAFRPADWEGLTWSGDGKLHALDLCRGVRDLMARHRDAVLVCDGGEIGQWAQSLLDAERRLINGVAGSIGPGIPFALAACAVEASAPVIAVMGDGTFGFHMAEFETAVRCGLPLLAVVGNDARWNAEHQIQLREYGENRAHGCGLTPARYDLVVEALGGHGELVTRKDDLAAALDRALASGKPACVNVMIESVAAPVIRR